MANGGEKGRAAGQEEVAKGGGVLPPAIGAGEQDDSPPGSLQEQGAKGRRAAWLEIETFEHGA
jgi:hypothetical protein